MTENENEIAEKEIEEVSKDEVLENEKPTKYSEAYQTKDFEGQRVEFTEVLDKEITIYDFIKSVGDYGEYAIIDAKLGTTRVKFLVGSGVIIQQLIRVKEDNNLPIRATIQKRHSETSKRDYYTLS